MNQNSSLPDIRVTTKPREQSKTRRIPPYNIILENDDYHSFEFVLGVLRKVFGCSQERAFQLTNEAHTRGRSIVWTGTKEVAELKVEQIQTLHEIRLSDSAKLGPLTCSIEPAPGA